jgi:hypothetical protein
MLATYAGTFRLSRQASAFLKISVGSLSPFICREKQDGNNYFTLNELEVGYSLLL